MIDHIIGRPWCSLRGSTAWVAPVSSAQDIGYGSIPLFEDHQRVVNVASVPQLGPFRYPGGETWLVPRLRRWLSSKNRRPTELLEPFADDGIVSLTVAFEGLAERVIMVELDELLAAVWRTIFEEPGGRRMGCRAHTGFELS
jgi:hypothetical protein